MFFFQLATADKKSPPIARHVMWGAPEARQVTASCALCGKPHSQPTKKFDPSLYPLSQKALGKKKKVRALRTYRPDRRKPAARNDRISHLPKCLDSSAVATTAPARAARRRKTSTPARRKTRSRTRPTSLKTKMTRV